MDSDAKVDQYKMLGLSPNANPDEIKKAYRRLAKQYHPDTNGGDKAKESKFKQISRAYDILSDPKQRAQYDAIRNGGPRIPPGFTGGGGFSDMGDIGEIFSQMFSGASPNKANVRYSVFSGADQGERNNIFDAETRRRGGVRNQRVQSPERTVRACDGSPLKARGTDMYSDLRLAVDEAILGCSKEVPTLTGKAKVRVPAGTSSGVKLRLKGKGAKSGGDTGDHYVTIQIDVPRDLDEDAKRLLIQFMRKSRRK